MIKIKKSRNTLRTADHILTKEELRKENDSHSKDVCEVMKWLADKINSAGERHDWTKKDYLDEFHADFSEVQELRMRESPGEKPGINQRHWYRDIHTVKERHHLMYTVPDDVNLIDILEYTTDCITSGFAQSGNVYPDKLPEEIVLKAYHNTWEMIKRNIEVTE
jgi:hypothetical protein